MRDLVDDRVGCARHTTMQPMVGLCPRRAKRASFVQVCEPPDTQWFSEWSRRAEALAAAPERLPARGARYRTTKTMSARSAQPPRVPVGTWPLDRRIMRATGSRMKGPKSAVSCVVGWRRL